MADLSTMKEAERYGYQVFARNYLYYYRSIRPPYWVSQAFNTLDEAACAAVLKGYLERPSQLQEALRQDHADEINEVKPSVFGLKKLLRWMGVA